MDGACTITGNAGCSGSTPEYTYVQASDVAPYFQLARQYGYANYMFQTNQGPSFPAHQFLLSGTSAPVYDDGDTNQYWTWFAAENDPGQSVYGCPAVGKVVLQISPVDDKEHPGYQGGYPCYNHATLVDVLEAPPTPITRISWKYYSHHDTASSPVATSLWTAPNAINNICQPDPNNNHKCNGPDWNNYVAGVFPNSHNYLNSYSPILTDLGADPGQAQCELPGVSWVVPDGTWSDHGGKNQGTTDAGPSWVASIVNAVGGYWYDTACVQHKTACWNGNNPMYWGNTAIIITWDDWGGWYDHVLPWNCTQGGTCSGYGDGESGDYIYGFRVPLLVVSAYTGTYSQSNGWSNYISGSCTKPNCPNEGGGQFVHDFGSILNFIEYAFGVGGKSIAPPGGIDPDYPYADYYAPDGPNSACGPVACPFGLSDFFPGNFQDGQQTFVPITQGVKYQTPCFLNPSQCWSNFTPSDPDSDVVDQD